MYENDKLGGELCQKPHHTNPGLLPLFPSFEKVAPVCIPSAFQ